MGLVLCQDVIMIAKSGHYISNCPHPWIISEYSSNPPSYNVWPDVVEAIRHVYIPNPLKAEYGSFFDKWVKDTSRYVRKCSTSMKSWLRMMRHNNGKARPMFLLTSAYQDFAEATLKFVLGALKQYISHFNRERWEEFFDFSIFHAEKPMFFNKKNPFYSTSVDCNTKVVADQLEGNRKVLGGNFTQLDKHLQLVTGKQNPKKCVKKSKIRVKKRNSRFSSQKIIL
ncbi:hypothetical protein HELRODRAFT_158634 [Helobdella robusta]|uniref:Uncharacterized protein n=1 Tax=Helobdella robusta TaxID=6412 RepID=T1EN19_HELRO|nr:hypothetical protein HELRODRAFT_158634 [Helobdella robusta]ESO12171.1 hypothetical protein HELRODRAFT_158634 [Helobdella robusta]